MSKKLTQEEGDVLLKIARNAIRVRLGLEPIDLPEETESLRREYATFVTLKKRGALRGCIGSLVPIGGVHQSIGENAVKAAFYDSRFPPLALEELDDVHIDISILTPSELLTYQDSADLIEKLRPGIDGVTIRKGAAAATFLPQVWEQLPVPELFLEHLCQKAGLSRTAWRDSKLDVEVYQVQCFEEEEK